MPNSIILSEDMQRLDNCINNYGGRREDQNAWLRVKERIKELENIAEKCEHFAGCAYRTAINNLTNS